MPITRLLPPTMDRPRGRPFGRRHAWMLAVSLLLHALALLALLTISRRPEEEGAGAPSYELMFETPGTEPQPAPPAPESPPNAAEPPAPPPTPMADPAPSPPAPPPTAPPTPDAPVTPPSPPAPPIQEVPAPTPEPAPPPPAEPPPAPQPPAPTVTIPIEPPPPPLPTPAAPPAPAPPLPEPAVTATPPTPEDVPIPQPFQPSIRLELPPPPLPVPQPLPEVMPQLPAPLPAQPPPRPRPPPPPAAGTFARPLDLNFGPAAPSRPPAPRVGAAPGSVASRSLDLTPTVGKAPNRQEAFFDARAARIGEDWKNGLKAYWVRHRYYPRQALESGEDGSVEVELTVNRLGRVETVNVISKSGSPWLDMAAAGTWRGAQLPPLPAEVAGDRITFSITINYILLR